VQGNQILRNTPKQPSTKKQNLNKSINHGKSEKIEQRPTKRAKHNSFEVESSTTEKAYMAEIIHE